jgi:hypothetical protein
MTERSIFPIDSYSPILCRLLGVFKFFFATPVAAWLDQLSMLSMIPAHVYQVRPRDDKRGVALPSRRSRNGADYESAHLVAAVAELGSLEPLAAPTADSSSSHAVSF